MKRTTLSLPEELAAIAAREAARRGLSVSELTRQALAAYLGVGENQKRKLSIAALGRSGEAHTARDLEEILAREWGDARGR